ncbi:MAG: glycoside hydrolase family 3 N-terminal domain-containing protein [Flavobacteriales bacterium]
MKLLVFILCISQFTYAQLYKDPTQSIDARVNDLLSRMTPAEKAWQVFMVPSDFDTTKCRFEHGIFGLQLFTTENNDPHQQILNYSKQQTAQAYAQKANQIQHYFVEQTRLGIPIIFFDEGLHGLVRGQATCFPQAIALAASFDTQLMQEVATQIALEAKFIGVRQILSPVLNLATDVRWGRVEETFGEDPYLASQMGLFYVRSMEQLGVVCTPKHFVVNVGDGGRDSYPIGLSERQLYMSHYRPFMTAVQKGKARSVMSAYNSLNGLACSANAPLLRETLKNSWGFEGFVISDANAVGGELVLHQTAASYALSGVHAIKGGLDVIFQTDCAHFELFSPGLFEKEVQEMFLDEAVKRVLRVKFELGLFEQPYIEIPNAKSSLKILESGYKLAQKAAENSFVLLKNESINGAQSILPLDKNATILLVGEAATHVKLGGYSGKGFKVTSIHEGLVEVFGKEHVIALTNIGAHAQQTYPFDNSGNWYRIKDGFKASYFDNPALSGQPVLLRQENSIDHHWTLYGPDSTTGNSFFSALWEAQVELLKDKAFALGLKGNDGYRLYVNDTCLIDQWEKTGFHERMIMLNYKAHDQFVVKVAFREPQGNGRIQLFFKEIEEPIPSNYFSTEQALPKADVAVVVVDYPEGEFQDRSSLALPENQVEMIRTLNACGLPVVVVIVGGSAVTMTQWEDDAKAILYNWYSGEAGGIALANMLAGKVNPSGKLPFTIPQHEGQLPLTYWHEPTGRGNDYVNGTGEPLFPFGFGLSYSNFEYSNLSVNKRTCDVTDTLILSLVIQNTGPYDGQEALQFYVKPLLAEQTLPVQYLIKVQKEVIKKGNTLFLGQIKIPITEIGIPTGPSTIAYPSQFILQVGSSSKDIRLQTPPIQINH